MLVGKNTNKGISFLQGIIGFDTGYLPGLKL